MKFAKITYYAAGIYGIIVLLPQYFLLDKIGQDSPPAITHPEFFYGFTGVALVFQLVFLLIAREPLKYRMLMPVTVLEKLSFGVPCIILYLQNRLSGQMLAAGLIDLALGFLFVIAFLKTSVKSDSAGQSRRYVGKLRENRFSRFAKVIINLRKF